MRRHPFVITLIAFGILAEPVAQYAATLPAFRLLDPLGRTFTHDILAHHGAIVVATAPTHSQGDAQYAWSAALHTVQPPTNGPMRVMLEDMSQSWFRPLVLAKMRETYRPTSSVILLLDEGGVTRKLLGVPEASTIAFAIAPGGAVVAIETASATPERAKRLLDAISRAPLTDQNTK